MSVYKYTADTCYLCMWNLLVPLINNYEAMCGACPSRWRLQQLLPGAPGVTELRIQFLRNSSEQCTLLCGNAVYNEPSLPFFLGLGFIFSKLRGTMTEFFHFHICQPISFKFCHICKYCTYCFLYQV